MSTPKKILEFGSYHSPSNPPQAPALPDSIRNEPNAEAELIDLKEHLISDILSELPADPQQLSEHLSNWSFKDIRLLYDILSRNRNLVNTSQTRHLGRSHQLVIDSKIETLLEELKTLGVLIPEPDQVKSYLSQYPSLMEKLPDICARVKTIPQNPAELSLEVKKRIESQEEVFTLYVRQNQYDEQLLSKLLDAMEEFEEWHSRQEGWIFVTTDFQLPVTERQRYFTVEEYLSFERSSKERHLWVDGHIYAMAGGSRSHNTICSNLAGEVHAQLKGKDCQSFTSDTKVRSGDIPKGKRLSKGMISYPDLTVVCGEQIYHDKYEDILLNPKVIFEVLSPGTQGFDETEKFRRYRENLDSLTDYVLVTQERPFIEHYTRQENGDWVLQTLSGLDKALELPSIECTLQLSELYARLQFPSEE